jgi:hypothetical protein
VQTGGPATIPVEQCITPEYVLPREGSPDSSPFLPLFRLAAYAVNLDAGEAHMGRKITIFLLLSLSYGALLLPQKWQSTERRWTDKNNTEQYAGYYFLQRMPNVAIVVPKLKSSRQAQSGSSLWTRDKYFI